MNNITYAVSVDVNNPIIPYNVYVASVLDSNVRYLEITLYQNGNVITLSNTATATASLVTDNVLVNDSVNCTISNNIITVPLEDLQRHGNLDVQVTVTEGTKVLAIPFPIQVRVTPNIAENAQIDENSLGSYAEVVHEIAEARGTYTTLHDAITAKLDNSANAVKTMHITDSAVTTAKITNGAVTLQKLAAEVKNTINAKEVKSNKKTTLTGNESSNDYYPTTKAVADALSTKAPASTAYTFDSTTANVTYNAANPKTIYLNAVVNSVNGIVITSKGNDFQYFFGRDGSINTRYWTGGTSYSDWYNKTEKPSNKAAEITNANKTSNVLYPTIKAVVDYIAANYLGSGNNTVSWANLAAAVQTLINGKESASNKLSSEEGIDSNSTDTEYPSAKAVYDLGVEIIALVNDDISNVESRLVLKESFSNKKNAIAGNETSGQYYPTTKAVYDYGSQISSAVEDVKAYIGYTSGDILGLHADFENKVFTRLGAADGLNAGSDFDAFPMYGQRRRVVVGSDGVIIDGYSPEDVGESDTDVDVMVYQPKFYYKVVPLKLEKQSSGLGYHIRKANYYISSTPHAGFKPHPLFFDKNGNEIDYVLFSAYEASYMWRRQVSTSGTDFRYVDSIFHDGVDTDTTIDTTAVLKSLPGVKPISGQYKALTKANMENCALRKSSNWHLDTIQSVSANQLLMAIEYGTFNTQAAIGLGIVNNSDSGSNNCSSLTGSTAAETFNTASGMASETIYDVAGIEIPFNTNGNVAVSYRGMENPWGNIWKQVNGINIWGDGTMNGGQVYIADNFNFNECSHSGDYKPAGFTIANAAGYISAFGYGDEAYDWLFMPSETAGNSSVPVSDNYYGVPNLNNSYRVLRYGGRWSDGYTTGGFCCSCGSPTGNYSSDAGGRLLFVPTAAV